MCIRDRTIQYQINTLMTTNGQSPFVTLFLHIDDTDEYVEETVMIIEEILRQRLAGTKNEKGIFVTPAFPKLVYVLDENNCLKGGKYDYVTRLAAKMCIRDSPLKKKYNEPDFEEECRTILTMMMAECCKEFEKLPILENVEILRNILYSGRCV